jgi:hypothetical protein
MWGGEGRARAPTFDPHTINACRFLFLLFTYLRFAAAASFDKKELCRSDTDAFIRVWYTNMFYSYWQLILMYLLKIFHFNKLRSVIGIKCLNSERSLSCLCLISSSLCVPPKQTQLDKIQIFCLYIDFPRSRGKGDSRSSVDIPVYIRTFFCLFCVNLACHLSKQIIFDRQGSGPPPLYNSSGSCLSYFCYCGAART